MDSEEPRTVNRPKKKKTNNQTEEIHKNKIGIALDVAEAGGWVGDKVSSIERDKSD